MSEFFNPEKGIWAWLSTLVDVVGLSVLWIALCLPVATIGPATAALYYTVVKCVRGWGVGGGGGGRPRGAPWLGGSHPGGGSGGGGGGAPPLRVLPPLLPGQL